MKPLVTLIGIALIGGMAGCTSGVEKKEEPKQENNLGSIPVIASRYSDSVTRLQKEQGTCSDVEKMFSFDSIIAYKKIEATILLYRSFDSLPKPTKLLFEQKTNLDKISIKDLRIVGSSFNEVELEATVEAKANSSFATPFASLTVYDASGKRLDVVGGIGIDTKLTSQQTYIFKGKMQNLQYLTPGFTVLFDEEITKW